MPRISTALTAVACLSVSSLLLTGCGTTDAPATAPATGPATQSADAGLRFDGPVFLIDGRPATRDEMVAIFGC